MISAKQIALVHVAVKQLKLDDDTYRAVLAQHGGGAESAKDLDHDGFRAVMEFFNRCGFRSTWTKRTFGVRPGMATPGQVDLIRKLWREWSGADDEAALNRWLERFYHVTALRFLPRQEAGKAVNGLRAMTKRSENAFQRLIALAKGEAPEGYSEADAVADYLRIHPECEEADVRPTLADRLAALHRVWAESS